MSAVVFLFPALPSLIIFTFFVFLFRSLFFFRIAALVLLLLLLSLLFFMHSFFVLLASFVLSCCHVFTFTGKF